MNWTYAPYAALHFATSDFASFEQEAAISAAQDHHPGEPETDGL
jgi:hypothetical protein